MRRELPSYGSGGPFSVVFEKDEKSAWRALWAGPPRAFRYTGRVKSTLALGLSALALGLALYVSLWGSGMEPGSGGAVSPDGISAELRALSNQVEANAAAQQQLAGEIEMLRAVLADEASWGDANAVPHVDAVAPGGEPAAHVPPQAPPQANPGFDSEALIAAGFSEDEVEAYQAYVDEADMRRLRLRDQAEREDWLGTSRFLQERQALMAEVENEAGEFSEELRDWALYSSGVPNRVRVSQVLTDSPAAAAGLQSGDVLLQYADTRVLRPRELRGLTSTGDAGVQTQVTVLRGGQEMRVYVPRGPLGVRLQPFRSEPQRPR